MRHELQAEHPDVASKVKFYIGNVRNPQSVHDAMTGVDFIFHAAALKQVSSCEFFPMEAVQTNVEGTNNVLHAAIEAVDLVKFAFAHAQLGDLFIQKSDASTIGVLAEAVQKLFGDIGTNIIGTRHGEKLYETLMTKEERLRSEDMGDYYRVSADNRDLNYDQYFVKGQVETEADEAYTCHNTRLLNVEETVEKILTTDYVKEQLERKETYGHSMEELHEMESDDWKPSQKVLDWMKRMEQENE